MFEEMRYKAGAVEINYAQGPPSGPPLVLLHGGGDRWQTFVPIMPGLAARWQLFALDLRGHGLSGRLAPHYRPEEIATDVIAFVKDQLGQPATLFGHSLGGWVALLAAVKLGNQVRALILGDPPLDIDRFIAYEGSPGRLILWRALREACGAGLSIHDLALRLADIPIYLPGNEEPVRYGDLPGVDPLHLRTWAATLGRVDPDVALYHASGRIDEYVQNLQLESTLAALACPTLIIQANPNSGGRLRDADVQRALEILVDGLSVKLGSVGHDLGLGDWDTVPLLRTLVSYLDYIAEPR